MSLDYQDCKVYVSNVDSQSSAEGGIIVQVLGEMSNKGERWRKFAQTFFLAEQPTGYFVLNDIFRYLKEDSDETEVPDQDEASVNLGPPVASQQAYDMQPPAQDDLHTQQPQQPQQYESESQSQYETPSQPAAPKPDAKPGQQATPTPSEAAVEETPAPAVNGIASETVPSPVPQPTHPESTTSQAPSEALGPTASPSTVPRSQLESSSASVVSQSSQATPAEQPSQPPQSASQAPQPAPAAPKTSSWANLASRTPANARGVASFSSPAPLASATSSVPSQPLQHVPLASSSTQSVLPAIGERNGPGGKPWRDVCDPNRRIGYTLDQVKPNCYLKNILEGVDASDVRQTLSKRFGTIRELDLMPDKGCGFVEFASVEQARRAVQACMPVNQGGAGFITLQKSGWQIVVEPKVNKVKSGSSAQGQHDRSGGNSGSGGGGSGSTSGGGSGGAKKGRSGNKGGSKQQ